MNNNSAQPIIPQFLEANGSEVAREQPGRVDALRQRDSSASIVGIGVPRGIDNLKRKGSDLSLCSSQCIGYLAQGYPLYSSPNRTWQSRHGV